MHLPDLDLLDRTHLGLAADLSQTLLHALPRVAHQQHETLHDGESEAEEEHGQGDDGAEQAVEPDVERDGEERQDEHDAGAGEGEEVGRVAEHGRQGGDVGEAHGVGDARVVLQPDGRH